MVPPEISTRRSGWSCWTIGLLSCLGAVALVIAVVAALIIYVSRRPEFKQAMSAGVVMAQCQQNMQEVYQAVERYRQRNNGRYPMQLNDLVPRYLAEAGKIKCPADLSNKPVSYRYFKPAKDSPETAPLLQCDHHRMFNEPFSLILLKNGQFVSTGRRSRVPQQKGGTDIPTPIGSR